MINKYEGSLINENKSNKKKEKINNSLLKNKRKNRKIKNITKIFNNKFFYKKNQFIFHFVIIILLILPMISNNIKEYSNRILELGTNQIKIRVNIIGNQEIIYNNFNAMPDKIFYNGIQINRNENTINIENNEESIILSWDNSLNDCSFMFCNLTNIIEVDLSDFDPLNVITMKQMFSGCINLKKIILGNNFISLKVTNVYQMFYNCVSLISLDLSKFDTSNIASMHNMFYGCKSLISLDISNFETSSVTRIEKIFKNCESLKSLDLSNFNTSLVNNMNSMFDGCKSLVFLNISSFNTSLVENMENMFKDCKNLLYLNLSNFNTSLVTTMRYMFANNEKIESLDLSNFNLSKTINIEKIFANCISLTSVDMSSFSTSLVENFEKMFFNCTSLTSLDISNLDLSSATDITFMFASCANLEYINFNSFFENETLDTTNMFLSTRDDLIYCIEDISKMPKIIYELILKECAFNDCNTTWKKNKDDRFEEKKKKIDIFEDKCVYKSIKDISDEFILTDKIDNTTIYSYVLTGNIKELKDINTNLTFIEITQEQIKYLLEQFNLDENEKIYILIIDTKSNDSMTATSWFDYKLLLENGTELNLSKLEINIDVNIYFYSNKRFGIIQI